MNLNFKVKMNQKWKKDQLKVYIRLIHIKINIDT